MRDKAKRLAATLWDKGVRSFILEYMKRTVTIYSHEVTSWKITLNEDHMNIMVLGTGKLYEHKTEIVGNRLNYFKLNEYTIEYLKSQIIQYFSRAFTKILVKSAGELVISLNIKPNENYIGVYKDEKTGQISDYWYVYRLYSISNYSPKVVDPEEQKRYALFFAKLHRRKPVSYAEKVN